MNDQFLKDVIEGMSNTPQKTLPSKYFYDKKGDELFVQIMAMPEYYLTKAEMDIFQNKTNELILNLSIKKEIHYEVIELGPGDGTKTVHLLKALKEQGLDFDYLPVDISENALNGLEMMLQKEIPTIKIKAQQGDYFVTLEHLHNNETPKIILVLGSNVGNLLDEEVTDFIYTLGKYLTKGDKIILGLDLIKEKDIVLPAYNDSKGITAKFNLNLLDRINKELNGDFNTNNFDHQPYYEKEEGIAKSYLRSKIKQTVNINNYTFYLEKGETIQTEISRKYNDEIIKKILAKTDITWEHKVMDSKNVFADYILVKN